MDKNMNEGNQIVNNISEYIVAIEEIYNNQNFINPNENNGLFFRGLSKTSYKLLPSVFRDEKFNERKIFLNYRDNMPLVMPANQMHPIKDRLKILVEMQHFGIPTRLLDWTLSPLVALYFAVREEVTTKQCEEDAVVWVFNPWSYSATLRPKNASVNWFEISKYARALLSDRTDMCDIKDVISAEFYGNSLVEDDVKYPFPLIAQYQNPRMVHQKGTFTIHGSCKTAFEDLSISNKFLKKIAIPNGSRNDILKQLKLLFINDYVIFPDYDGIKNQIHKTGSLYFVR